MNILKVLTDKRKTGNVGEDAVCRYLKRNGYKILERNYVSSGHEIDIVAEDKEHICFVEVKTRTQGIDEAWIRPADAVDAKKQRSIISAAREFALATYGRKKYRFDVAEVFLDKKQKVISINYLVSAFTLDGNSYRYQKKG